MLLVVAFAAALALMSLGGGFYEALVVDPFWPKRPDLVQPCLLLELVTSAACSRPLQRRPGWARSSAKPFRSLTDFRQIPLKPRVDG
jgi:hypothetical protein